MDKPVAPIRPVQRTFHGHTFVDNYEWLRDKQSPETIGYLEAENAYVDEDTAHLEKLRENIFYEIKSRVKETDMSVPSRRDDYWHYSRSEEGKSYGIRCRIPAEITDKADPDYWSVPNTGGPAEEILLDSNVLAEGHDYFQLGPVAISPNSKILAYGADFAGDERFTIYFKDLETGELLPDRIEETFYDGIWCDDEYFFYTRVDDAWRPFEVWRHRLGTDASEDVCVYREEDPAFAVGIGSSVRRKYLFIYTSTRTSTEVRCLERRTPTGEFRVLFERTPGVELAVDDTEVGGEECWVVTHNAFGPNFAVGWVPVGVGKRIAIADLQPLLPHRDDARIEGVSCYRDYMLVDYRSGGIPRAGIMPVGEGFGALEELQFDEELYSASIAGVADWEAPVCRLGYTSFTTPSQLYSLHISTGERTLLKEQEVLGEFDREAYTARRLWVPARDGALVPVSLLHRADLDLSKPNPTVLYGYGSYEISRDPGFSVSWLPFLDRGMIVAIAHVRGGGEMGRLWYDDGKIAKKKNTFYDFIDCADKLIDTQVTSPEMFVAVGGSAGGLLMGAVANMAGDRFVAIEANVPFVDNLTSMLMPELPLTIVEWEEWGNPVEDPEIYEYMASYAPYENVEAKNYPNILATTSLNDTRVLYVEPAKWIAKLRATATGGEFYLKTEMAAGHGGVSGRYESWHQLAFEFSWLINQATGLTE